MNKFLRLPLGRMVALAAAAIVVVTTVGLAAPASADASLRPRVEICTPSNAWVSLGRADGSGWVFCAVGVYDVAGTGPFTEMSSVVLNRIWLHQNPDGSGWADCFRGRLSWPLRGRDQNPGNLQISSNTKACS